MQSYKVKKGLAYRCYNSNKSIIKGYRYNAEYMMYWTEYDQTLINNSYEAQYYHYIIRLKTTQSKLIRTILDNTYQIK